MKIEAYPKILLSALCLLLFSNFIQAKTTGFFLLNDADKVRIEVEIQNNVILLPLRINGSFVMNFILDTGVKTTILTEPAILPFINLDSMDQITVKGLGKGEAIEANLARDVGISLPGVRGRGINMVVMPDGLISYSGMFSEPVYGIIGYELFGQFIVEINYQSKYIVLHNPFRYSPPKWGKWEELPIELNRCKPYISAEIIDFQGTKVKENWLLDTGASMAISLFHDELPEPDKSIPAFLGKGLTGEVHGQLGRSPIFKIGSFEFEDILTGYPDEESLRLFPDSMDWYGNIGSDVISRFNIIFDYLHKKVYLKKNANFSKVFEYNVAGLEFLSMEMGNNYGSFLITYVRPESPAALAGIKKDDILLQINGSSVHEMEIDELYGDMLRKTGKFVRLRIKRGDDIILTRFLLNEEL
jgi:predicted aspartyl protease